MKKTPKIKKISRKKKMGLVVRKKMPHTAVVELERLKEHRYYHKRYKSTRRLAVDDQKDVAKVGDKVIIEECRPISKTKKWRLTEIISAELKHQTAKE